ncbi:MAG TPA: nuclear transport factor 2 family protein [Thermoleophilaceae bacterium]|jgi:ketosteroid isomerase-like protein
MTQSNVEIVRAAVRSFVEQDVVAARELFWPDVVMAPPDGWPDGRPEHGREAVLQQFARLGEDWQDNALTIEEVATEGDAVAVRLHWRTTGGASAVPVEMSLSGVYFVRDGRVAEMRFFREHDAALDAAGIRR